MSYAPQGSLVERLEDRRYAAKGSIVESNVGVSVWIDADRVLHVRGTPGNDDISLRRVGNRTRVTVASVNDLRRDRVHVVQTDSAVDIRPVRLVRPDLEAEVFQTMQSVTYVSSFSVPTSVYRKIAIDGGAGTDVARGRRMTVVPVTRLVEKTLFNQVPAPAGSTPSDPASGVHFGPKSYWAKLDAQQRALADASAAEIAFVGDSHAAMYATVGRRSWRAAFPHALDLGIPGDSTRQLLTRLKNGLFDRFKPKTLVVMIGANNLIDAARAGTDEQIFGGVRDVMKALRRKLPDTRLILVGVMPQHGQNANERIQTLNAHVADYAGRGGFTFVDVYSYFTGDPVRSDLLLADDHLTPKGYQMMTALLTRTLKTL